MILNMLLLKDFKFIFRIFMGFFLGLFNLGGIYCYLNIYRVKGVIFIDSCMWT